VGRLEKIEVQSPEMGLKSKEALNGNSAINLVKGSRKKRGLISRVGVRE